MTRINANIEPYCLTDQHLLAEYREIVRIPKLVYKKINNNNKTITNIPNKFILGTGHVCYFYDKLKFLHLRFLKLKEELNNRNIENNINDDIFIKLSNSQYYNNINEDMQYANDLIKERITKRLFESKQIPKYYKKSINVENAIDLFNKN